MDQIKNFLRKKKFLAILGMVVVAGCYFGYRSIKAKDPAVRYITSPVARGTLISSVSGTGQVEASEQVEIKPQVDGTITKVSVKENQQVKKGDALITIDQQSAANDVAKARASVEQARASYDKLVSGATSNQVESQKLSVASAERALEQAKKDYENTIIDQQQAVDKSYSDLLNGNLQAVPNDNLTTATLSLSGSYLGKAEGKYTISLYDAGDGVHYHASGLGAESGLIKKGLSQPLGNGLYATFSTTGTLNNFTTWIIDVPNQRSSSYLGNLNSYSTSLQNQKKSIEKARNSITSAEDSLSRAKLQMAETMEPATSADIASAKAQITSAEAQLENAIEALGDTVIRAPFDGVVADLKVDAGDEANSGSAIATIITQHQVAKITLNEVDAARVKLGQKATLTFSSVSDLAITGTIADIDNIGTVSQNVVNFSVVIAFDTQDARIKPGMSVSASVITGSAQDVLMVPAAAVKSAGGQSYVQTLAGGEPQQRIVTIGLSNDTDTEISGDIQEGEEVVTQTITGDAANPSQAGQGNILQSLTGNRSSGNRSTSGGTFYMAAPAGGGPTIISK